MISALLFDLDGTLVDSDAEHLVAFQRAFAKHGVSLDRAQYVAKIMGASNEMIGEAFLAHLPPPERAATIEAKEAAYREALGNLVPIAGAVALIQRAAAEGLKLVVVTNAPRANADVVLRAIGLDAHLPIRVIGGELARAKPDPLPYLTGLELTGASAEHSVAFEDSLSGARAAVAAGIAVVGVMTTLDEATLRGVGVTLAVRDLADPRIYNLIESRRARA